MQIQNEDKDKRIEFRFSNKLGNFRKLITLSDEKYVL
jgi:hypothetical protein